MSRILNCPHCDTEIVMRELKHQGYWQSYRICPGCGGKLTVDRDTKIRQMLFILVALMSLVFTLFHYFVGGWWIYPSIASYVALGLLIWWGNSKVILVRYEEKNKG
jgi:hypothetical protein